MANNTNTDDLNRCRLILTASAKSVASDQLVLAASAGDVASVILYSGGVEAHEFESYCKDVTPRKARHNALEIGELKPDFVFFGKLAGDIKAEAHPKNIALAEWWAELVEIPGIVMGGSDLDSIIDVALSGIDFVALERAIFAEGKPDENVAKANALLDKHAPALEEEDV